jgi:superfamily II DNA or RNA helicase
VTNQQHLPLFQEEQRVKKQEIAKSINLLWDDSLLVVAPAPPRLLPALTITEKSIVQERWQTKVVKTRVKLYKEIGGLGGSHIIQTYHGFVDDVLQFLQERGYATLVHDRRLAFPKPKMEAAHGFRFGQLGLFTEAVRKNRSGIIEAPTRYGKTVMLINLLRVFPEMCSVVTVPGSDLLDQLYEDVKKAFPHRNVVKLGGGSRVRYPSEDITVCSMDSLDKCDHGRTRLLVIDEIHAAVTNSRLGEVRKFETSRIYGLGATPGGRFDQRDRLIVGLIGPVLARKTFREGLAEGAISPIMVYMLRIPIGDPGVSSRNACYNRLLFENERMAEVCAKLCHQLIPEAWQTLVFIRKETQADMVAKAIGGDRVIAMAKKMKNSERKVLVDAIKAEKFLRVVASDILSQGVTMSKLRCIINASSGGPYTSCIQKPGRLAEIRPDIPDKKYGIIFDFLFESKDPLNPFPKQAWGGLIHEANARKKAYEEKGYEVVCVSSYEELQKHFTETHLKTTNGP